LPTTGRGSAMLISSFLVNVGVALMMGVAIGV